MAEKSNRQEGSSLLSIPDSCAVLSVAQTYAADLAAAKIGLSSLDLMEAAGASIAKLIQSKWAPRPVVVLCGLGNNGGDGFVAARHLAMAGWEVTLALYGDVGDVKGDAATNSDRWLELGRSIAPLTPDLLANHPLVVDALFGAGLNRPLESPVKDVIEYINRHALACVAADIPSGVNGDTGAVLGAANCAPRCVATVTFFRPKPGHLLYPGRDLCGEITVADIGIPNSVLKTVSPRIALNGPGLWTLPTPSWGDHKYTRGHAMVVGGGRVTGAARLAARGARRAGAGLITLAVPSEALSIYAMSEPGTFVSAVDCAEDFAALMSDTRLRCVLIGPGCGVGPATVARVLQILDTDKAVILDADALTSFENEPEQLFAAIRRRVPPVVLTPHGGEFERLFGAGDHKLSRTIEAARVSGAIVVSKGADTVVASPAGPAGISVNAPPWLATGGSGDVLAGIILGLLTQEMPPWEAAMAAVWLHGEAGSHVGRGLIAEDIPEILPKVLKSFA